MKQTSTQQNHTLGCYVQSAISGVLLTAVFAFAFNALADAVVQPDESSETAVQEVVVPTDVPTIAVVAPPRIQPTAVPTVQPTTAVETSVYDPAAVAVGQTTFSSLCVACHGQDARGLPNLGKDLVNSEFMHGLSDEELLEFIRTGRPIWDPNNTTGVDMPPRGGNPALTDEQLLNIVAYLRSLGDT